ncbi:MAG: endonuclease MutS2 [Candidatus Cloacimonetes bacterium]|nr:endonuclease MutS2 [Candidatus Cloacimonadota bacterium]
MKNAFEELEFYKVKALIKNCCTSSLGGKLVDQLQPLQNKSEIEERINELSDSFEFLSPVSRGQKNSFHLEGLADTKSLFPQLNHKEHFTIPEFLLFAHNVRIANNLKRNEAIKERNFPHLFSIVSSLVATTKLEKLFDKTFDNRGEIKDSASDNLKRIRRKRQVTRKRIYSQLEDILEQKQYENIIQDRIITIRDQRHVIPVREGGDRTLKGLIHGRSKTGSSIFLEPLSILDLNNSLITLDDEEKQEINKILNELFNTLQDKHEILFQNLKILQKIDYLNASAKYCFELGTTVPEICTEPIIKLTNARHPLLHSSIDKDKIVPFSLNLGDDYRTLVISGVNTGGKTVTLKAIGLLSVMALSGLMIPAEKAEIGIFHNFFTDINDEQSIEDSISTFSSHIKKLRIILNEANEKSLVLIDELGSGTDPEEGSALAQAILERLISQKVKVIITTHLNKLKIFATGHPLCENASMRFDQEKLLPTYQFDIGFPGNSYALDIAREYEMPKDVVNSAHELLDPQSLKLSNLLRKTEQQRVALSQKISEYNQKNMLVEQHLKSLQEKEKNWKNIEKQKKLKAIQEAEEFLLNLQQEFEYELIKLKARFRKENQIEPKEVKKFANKIEKEKSKIYKQKDELAEVKYILFENPKIGNLGFIKSLNVIGKIVEIEKSYIKIKADGILYSINKKDLYKVPDNKKLEEKRRKSKITTIVHTDVDIDFAFELNIMGLTFNEALPEIDKYIDKAILMNLQRISILHGKGTGQLRKKIWNYFKTNTRIADYHSAPESEGGSGVTIAVIK